MTYLGKIRGCCVVVAKLVAFYSEIAKQQRTMDYHFETADSTVRA